MPEKDPLTWTALLSALPDTVHAALVGSTVAFLRVMYDDREPSIVRRMFECALCGAISMCIASLAEAAGLSGNYSAFIGGSVGLLGADQVRTWARKLAQRRFDAGKP
jgi:lambda family phage holin